MATSTIRCDAEGGAPCGVQRRIQRRIQRGHEGGAQRGITLIEACMVLAISAVLIGAAVPGLQGVIDARRVNGAASQLATDLQAVRTEAVLRNQPVRLSFYSRADATCWVVHTGSAAQCACDAPGAAVCGGGATAIKTVQWPSRDHVRVQANVASMLFDPLHGTSTPTG